MFFKFGFSVILGGAEARQTPPLGAPLIQRDIATLHRVFKSRRRERACRNELYKTSSAQAQLWRCLSRCVAHMTSQIGSFILVWGATAARDDGGSANHRKPQGSRCHGRDSNWTRSKYEPEISPKQDCANPGRLNSFTVAPNICGSSVWDLLRVTLLAPRIFRCFLDLWQICAPLL